MSENKTESKWEEEMQEIFDDNFNETLWATEESNEVMRVSLDEYIKAVEPIMFNFISRIEQEAREEERRKTREHFEGEIIIEEEKGQFSLHTDGYNQALEEVVDYLK